MFKTVHGESITVTPASSTEPSVWLSIAGAPAALVRIETLQEMAALAESWIDNEVV